MIVERVLTDNAFVYRRSHDWHQVLDEHGIGHRLIRPYRPQTNGKVERFNRTLLDEWAYQRPYTSEPSGKQHSPTGWTGRTTTDHTPESAVRPQPAAPPTCPDNTPRSDRLCI